MSLVAADALLAGHPDNHDRDDRFGEGAIVTNRATAKAGAERVIEALLHALKAKEGGPAAGRSAFELESRTRTPEGSEAIHDAVSDRRERVEEKAAELCKAIDGDGWRTPPTSSSRSTAAARPPSSSSLPL